MDARRLTPEQAAVRAEFYRCPYDKVDKIRYTVPGDKLNKPEHLADEYFQNKHPVRVGGLPRGPAPARRIPRSKRSSGSTTGRASSSRARACISLEMLASRQRRHARRARVR